MVTEPTSPANVSRLRPRLATPTTLPAQPTPLVGRDHDLVAAAVVLHRPEVRLLTLTGPGGVGKTRLALQLAADTLDAFPDGVWFVPLAPITDPALVAGVIAQALGVWDAGRSPQEALHAFLRERIALLVLDNLEHLSDAADNIAALLAACPSLCILATSRVPLHLRAEQEFTVGPLVLPSDEAGAASLERIGQSTAVQLFLERAGRVRPDVALTEDNAAAIAGICRRLDGLPLALELAAARMKALSPGALLAQLDRRLDVLIGGPRDLPARQRTLRDTIRWSYDLLSEPEQRLFRRFAVCVGGCTLAAAAWILDPEHALGAALLEHLTALVDQSVLYTTEDADGEPRFRMLETVREFAAEQLAADDEAADTARRHATYFLALAEACEPLLITGQRLQARTQLVAEEDSLRAALAFGAAERARDDGELALRLAGALGQYWEQRGAYREGQVWLERVLTWGEAGPPGARAKALTAASSLAYQLGPDFAGARLFGERAIALWRDLGDGRGAGVALNLVALAASALGDLAAARAQAAESVALLRQHGEPWSLVAALGMHAWVERRYGDLAAARAVAEESVALARRANDPLVTGRSLELSARSAQDQGDVAAARALFEQSLPLLHAAGTPWLEAFVLRELGEVAIAAGDYDEAARRFTESLALAQDIGAAPTGPWRALAFLARLRGDLRQATAYVGRVVAYYQPPIARVLAACLADLGGIAVMQEEPHRAARLFGASAALCTPENLPPMGLPFLLSVYEQDVAAARDALGEAAFAAAWAEGQTQPVEALLAEALQAGAPLPPAPDAVASPGSGAAPTTPPDGLTAREVEVLRLLAAGQSNQQIGAALVISLNTVARHISHIFDKIGAANRTEAANFAHRQGLAAGPTPAHTATS
jgi:predicted ATPase/DNA-binding CsgD family transcriptional regulator